MRVVVEGKLMTAQLAVRRGSDGCCSTAASHTSPAAGAVARGAGSTAVRHDGCHAGAHDGRAQSDDRLQLRRTSVSALSVNDDAFGVDALAWKEEGESGEKCVAIAVCVQRCSQGRGMDACDE